MKISFIIVNYKSKKYLEACLASIFEKVSGVEFEIIIVNNDQEKIGKLSGIEDGRVVVSELGEFEKSKGSITVIEVNKNVGFSRANNIGAAKSNGDYCCFLNPDTKIISKNIIAVIKKFDDNLNIGIIGPKIIKKNKTQAWSVGVDMDIKEIMRSKRGVSESEKIWQSDEERKVDWVSGASLFIRRELFLKVGGFDEKFFLYYEDVDLCKRIKNLPKQVLYFPMFEIEHLEGKSSSKKYEQKVQYFKSQDYYYKKWFSAKEYYCLKFIRFFYLWGYRIKHGR